MVILIWPHHLLPLSYSEILAFVLPMQSMVGVIRHTAAQKLFLAERETWATQRGDTLLCKAAWADTVVPISRRRNLVCLTWAVQCCAPLPTEQKSTQDIYRPAPIRLFLWSCSVTDFVLTYRNAAEITNQVLNFPRNYYFPANEAPVNTFWLLQSSWSNS